jgi:hypothetical protein
MKIIILPLSSYVNINQSRAIRAFSQLGVSKWSILYHWISLPGYLGEKLNELRGDSLPTVFDWFNEGQLSPLEFRTALKRRFRALENKSDEQINAAWNAMCTVTDYSRDAFRQVSQLHDGENIKVVFHSNTNPLHLETIQNRFGQTIPGNHCFSFVRNKTGISLLTDYIEELNRMYPGQISPKDIIFVYSPPPAMPYPRFGLFSWIFAPFQSWAASKAQSYVNQLERLSENNFTLVPNQATKSEPNILKSVADYLPKPEFPAHRAVGLTAAAQSYTPGAAAAFTPDNLELPEGNNILQLTQRKKVTFLL